ncbi:MAG TPA: MFS transporter [Stellaceae bacterium]|nr:MFS transporter [Stellaceae bacterium]
MTLSFGRLLPGGVGNATLALAHRNYRIYAGGNAVSLVGIWMQRVSVGWLAWTLTHSGTWLGVMSMAEFFPVVFLSPLAGALADRRDRVGIIRVTQIAGSTEAVLLAVLVYTGAISIWLLFALTFLLGVFNAVAQPSRLALIPTLVDRPSLASALAINAIIFNSARFVGPAVAGIVIARLSVGAAFAVNAGTYLVFLVAMANLRGLPALPAAAAQSVLRASAEAYSYASRHPGIAPMLLLFTVTTIGTRGFVELFPGFADRVFGRGPEGLSMLTSTVGLGAICGGAWLLLRPGIAGLTGVVLGNTLVISLAILGFTATSRFYVALPCVFLAGGAMTITGIGAQTLIQAAVEVGMRGRIMALYGMIFRAGPALGAVLMGSLSERFGLRLPLAVGAVVSCGFWAFTWARQKRIAETLESEPAAALAGAASEARVS